MNTYIINKPTTYMYDIKGNPVDELLYGWEITAIGELGKKCVFCKTDYGYVGYVKLNDLLYVEDLPKYSVVSRFCDVLKSPQYFEEPLFTLPYASRVYVKKEGEKFTEIKLDDETAYVPSVHIKRITESKDVIPYKIISTAKKYLDTPYRWSGKSTFGIDCSGLCFMSYYLNGIRIYRDAHFAFYKDYEISLEKIRPSDLIFFEGHVAIYIGGEKIIHSNAVNGKVKITPFDKSKVIGCASLKICNDG